MHGMAGMGKLMRAIGMMSGTSMDGVDIALLETDGEDAIKRGPARSYAYPGHLRPLIVRAIDEARPLHDRQSRPGALAEVEDEITRVQADALEAFLAEHVPDRAGLDVVGFHGQTVLHRPEIGLTIQLGRAVELARSCGIDVVHDLRANDCREGGQGAPLVPVYHRAVVARLPQRPVAVLNIGGVANVTWIGRDGQLLAFDTGPGNAMIDDWMLRTRGEHCDRDGRLAAQGRVQQGYVAEYLRHSHFALPPPKSLDRNAFALELVDMLSAEDGAATLTAFTAAAVARAREHMPEQPQLWLVTGGGRMNKTLMSMIAGLVDNAVAPAEAAGLDGDTMEAEAWAYLAVRSLAGLPITFPGTTGVPQPMTGGVLARAPRA